ncbi:hypothetical protein Q5H93_14570 [Hymenobacter sp. ASUV-10]|uniref:Tetratricopeptide repeat protein n=1 Tax=Hymenobacter aranciens TaxID=3063996 RepID=A0ABT9BDW3_9BACT|nr:hypothetical protein [Hymenobacter sp. ASUV-10]MDO7875965.1 hypothetical protein [Hymenobacter sp. ASUV-10]
MTRTALLQLLDHPTAIAPAEVQELEQLARAFPYCQTAHLLLAKAAHDQGTMLASQRLRRAATYAADRTLLRQLIEQTVAEPEPELVEQAPVVQPVETVAPQQIAPPEMQPEPAPAVAETASPAPEVAPRLAPVPLPEVVLPTVATVATVPEAVIEAPVLLEPLAAILAAAEPIVSKIQKFNINQPAVAEADSTEDSETEAQPEAAALAETPVVEPAVTEDAEPEQAAMVPEPEPVISEAIQIDSTAPDKVIIPEPAITTEKESPVTSVDDAAATEEPSLDLAQPATPTPTASEEPPLEIPEPEIPPVAPPIRPPEEVGSARFEFGLQDEPKPAATHYELPLVDEWAAAATPLALPGADDLNFELPGTPPAAPATLKWTAAAFTGDTDLGYALDEGSRLGFGLGLLTEALLAKIETESEGTLAHEIVAAPRPAPLPPTAVFFEPDVLLLEHWATHRPIVPPTPSSSELINSFLRRQPRLTRPAMLPPSPTAQADLSVKSTRPEPELISEGLARILARQGKIERAIEIYERLMVKQPEKMAYFAAQIQQLQPSA